VGGATDARGPVGKRCGVLGRIGAGRASVLERRLGPRGWEKASCWVGLKGERRWLALLGRDERGEGRRKRWAAGLSWPGFGPECKGVGPRRKKGRTGRGGGFWAELD